MITGKTVAEQASEVLRRTAPDARQGALGDAAELRRRAEPLAARPPETAETLSPDETRKALHELRVYQIELEMQNEALRRAQAELGASRTLYFDLYNLAPVGYVTVSGKGMILEANIAAANLLGVARDALVNRSLPHFILKEDGDIYYMFLKKLFATGDPQACEVRRVMKKVDAPCWMHVAATAAQGPGGATVCRMALSDITERKRAEAYREMGAEVLQALNEPDALPDSIRQVLAVLKAHTGFDALGIRLQDGADFPYFDQQGFSEDFLLTENSLVVRGADGSVCRDGVGNVSLECTCGLVLSGRTDPSRPFFTRGGSFWTNDALPLLDLPADQDPRQHPRNVCIHQGHVSVALIPIRDKDHIVGLLHLNDRRKGCFTLATVELLEGIAAHIGTALIRKRAQEDLRASEERLDLALSSARMGVWQWDVVADKRTFDGQTCALLGLDPATFSGSAAEFLAAVHPDDRDKIRSALALTLSQDLPYALEYRAVWPDGSVRHVSARGHLVHNEKGWPLRLLGVVWDVSKQRRDEDELQKLQTLQMVGTLAGGIAHDFNNILLRLFGNITMAMADLSKEHPSYAPLDAAQKAKEHAIRLTKQLLTFAKGGAPVKENIGLGLLVEEVARFNLSGSNVGLDCWQAEHLWQTQADKGQIQQVVANLVINARQAMPEGGHLHISLENSSLPPPVFPGLREGRYVKISLRDEGSGIDPSLLGRIFDPYFTTSQTGSGLGLATVWSIINRHGGHIGVVSALGEGTNFTFYLPASEIPRPAPAAPPLAAADPAQARSAKILVMDDDEDVLVLATRMLRRCGHSVVTAPGGKEALALYRQAFEAGEPFDAVIMDLTIPGGIGGRQAVGELLSFDPKARAIVSSGYSESPVMADPAAYGFRGAAVKPYDQSELSEIVALVLA